MSTTVDLLLARCSFSCTTEPHPGALRIYAPDRGIADALKALYGQLALEAKRLGRACAEILWPGCDRPYQIPVAMATSMAVPEDPQDSPASSPEVLVRPPSPESFGLLGADYCEIHEFLVDQRRQGNIVIITSNTTGICYHTNDLLKPSRGVLKPHEWTGYNYLRSWRASLADWDHLNPELPRLQELLARDGMVPGYEYTLFRPDDALCSYSTSYFLCRDYMGDEVRVGVSRPQDWAMLTPGEESVGAT
jgi:hypothetical protein